MEAKRLLKRYQEFIDEQRTQDKRIATNLRSKINYFKHMKTDRDAFREKINKYKREWRRRTREKKELERNNG